MTRSSSGVEAAGRSAEEQKRYCSSEPLERRQREKREKEKERDEEKGRGKRIDEKL
jgi:hypothetical protein